MIKPKPYGIYMSNSHLERLPFEMTASKQNDTAVINLKGYISDWTTASSGEIEKHIKTLKEDGITKATLYINSGGGSVFEANEIANLLDENFDDINVVVGSLAASAATIFVAKYNTTVKRNSKLMIHKPMTGVMGNEDKITSQLKMLQDATNDYRSMYAVKMNLSEDEVEALWKNDYWMNAKEAKKQGLVDAILNEDEQIDASLYSQLVACGAPNCEQLKPKSVKINTMDKQRLCATLGLPSDATEAQIEAKLDALKQAEANAEALRLKAEQDAADQKKANIKALLDGAEKDRKIKASQRAHYETLANADFENTKAVIDGLTPAPLASQGLDPNASTEDKSYKTYQDYLDNDAMEAFDKLEESEQTKLIEAHYSDK